MSRPNIVVLVMDTARATTVFDGIENDCLPNLGALAADGTTFTNCMTTAPWTLPSHASMFTGQYTSEHLAHTGTKRFDPDIEPLPRKLSTQGYQTVAYSNNTWISPDFGFDAGFDDFYVRWQLLERGQDLAAVAKSDDIRDALGNLWRAMDADAPYTLVNSLWGLYLNLFSHDDDGAKRTTDRLTTWLDHHNTGQPFFMFANYVEPHLRYDPPEPYRTQHLPADPSPAEDVNQDPWKYITGEISMSEDDFDVLKALYAAELAYLDTQLGALFDHLREIGEYEQTVVVVVGDHGENIGEHDLMDHQYCLYDTLLRVPLFIHDPGQRMTTESVDSLVELRDIFPTILDFAGIERPENETISSNSLLQTDQRDRDYIVAEYLEPQPSMSALRKQLDNPVEPEQYDRALRCIRTDDWKFIEGTDGRHELYDLGHNEGERRNIIHDHQDKADALHDYLQSEHGELQRKQDRNAAEMDASTEQRLEDLGYIQ